MLQRPGLWRSLNRALSTHSGYLDIGGIFPPIATPFRPDYSLDIEALTRNIKVWNSKPLKGLVVMGSNSETPFLTLSEKTKIVAHARSEVRRNMLIVAGSGCQSTAETIDVSQALCESGADAVLTLNPSYYQKQMTNSALVKHYDAVANAVSKPLIAYNVPANTGMDMTADVIIDLAQHPNIIGLKDSGGDVTKLGTICHLTENFQVLAGSAGFLLPALSVGCVGGIVALANILGEEICQLFNLAVKESKFEEARALQQRLIVPNTLITKQFGVPGLKKAMDLYGITGGVVRPPLIDISSEIEIKAIINGFETNGFKMKNSTF